MRCIAMRPGTINPRYERPATLKSMRSPMATPKIYINNSEITSGGNTVCEATDRNRMISRLDKAMTPIGLVIILLQSRYFQKNCFQRFVFKDILFVADAHDAAMVDNTDGLAEPLGLFHVMGR